MINQLYIEVKTTFAKEVFQEYDKNSPIKKSFEKIWFNMAKFKLNNKEEASFLSQCDDTYMVDEKSRKEGLKLLQPVFDLWLQGQHEGIIKEISPYLLYAYTIYPMAFLMNMQKRGLYKFDEQVFAEAFQAAWDSIKV